MKKLILTIIIFLNFSCANSQKNKIDQNKIKEDLNKIITYISNNYIYLQEKNVDLNCIQEYQT